jgi:hypothetical protein
VCETDCRVEWPRAEAWLHRHARLKVQPPSDTIVQTVGITRRYPLYAFVATRSTLPENRHVIRVALTCGNGLMGCKPSGDEVRRAFLHFVSPGEDLLPALGRLAGIRLGRLANDSWCCWPASVAAAGPLLH